MYVMNTNELLPEMKPRQPGAEQESAAACATVRAVCRPFRFRGYGMVRVGSCDGCENFTNRKIKKGKDPRPLFYYYLQGLGSLFHTTIVGNASLTHQSNRLMPSLACQTKPSCTHVGGVCVEPAGRPATAPATPMCMHATSIYPVQPLWLFHSPL